MNYSYLSIAKLSEGFFKDKNSKFYAYAYPVSSKEEIKDRIDEIKNLYSDATHHCYAWILGSDKELERANDDGEPSSSAGKPILRQILSKNITNCLVVVVRYYGGKKLGVPGLINAYGEAARLALEENSIIEQEIMAIFQITCPFGMENEIYRASKKFEGTISPVHSLKEFVCQFKTGFRFKEDVMAYFADLHKFEIQLGEN